MKKYIFAAIAAIAMLAGVQPAFAVQISASEVIVNNDQCYVFDLPAGATAEVSEFTAPWQAPGVQEVTYALSNQSTSFSGTGDIDFSGLGGVYSVKVALSHTSSSSVTFDIYGYDSSGNNVSSDYFTVGSATGINFTFTSSSRMYSIKIMPRKSTSGYVFITY